MKIQKVSIKDINLNKENPRTISKEKKEKLIKSIKEFPKMLEIRPIVVDDTMTILGGNMRYTACKEAGLKEVYIIKASDLSEEQKRQFVIKDNVGFGEWDWDVLENQYMWDELDAWGMDMPKIPNKKQILPDNIIALFIDLKDEDKQKELYDKLIELGYNDEDIKLMSFSVDDDKKKIIVDETKINKHNKVLTFSIDRINEPEITYNVKYVLDKFDMDYVNKQTFSGEIDLDFDWNVGLIVGNSGTGKTTIAKELFGDNYITDFKYNDKSILDNFDGEDINNIIQTLTSVGLASTTTWLKPYNVLSGGEKMRCDLAKAITSKEDLIVFDEFTSVLDRNIARIGSHIVQKNIRKHKKRFIAVGCHFDVEDWLRPDWIFNTNDMTFSVDEEVQKKKRPTIRFDIRECVGSQEKKKAWKNFSKYHYLTEDLNMAARVYVGYVNDEIACFSAILPLPNLVDTFRISRSVVLPDFQGIGLSNRMSEFLGEEYNSKYKALTGTTTHPGLIKSRMLSNRWEITAFDKEVSVAHNFDKNILNKRLKASFRYIPKKINKIW